MANQLKNFGAIDVGSNGIRVMIGQYNKKSQALEVLYKKRVALRLGTEAFSREGCFSQDTIKKATQVFTEFSCKFKKFHVNEYAAFATSAFRDAQNSRELAKTIESKTGIQLKRMSGDLEAKIVLKSIVAQTNLDDDKDYLLFDLGGGSLELSQIEQGCISGSRSFDLGTVRLMNYMNAKGRLKSDVTNRIKKNLSEILKFLDKKIIESQSLIVIGTGGNFRRLLKVRNMILGEGKNFIHPDEVPLIEAELNSYSYEDRIKVFGLRRDRADVIIPAVKIISSVLDILPVKKVLAPNVGLVDGIIYHLIEQ